MEENKKIKLTNELKTVKGLRFHPAHKLTGWLACHTFVDAGRRQISGSETKDLTTYSLASTTRLVFVLP